MRTLELPAALRRRIEEHVGAAAPEEACGVLLGRETGEGPRRVLAVRPTRNGADDRRRAYVLEPADLVAAVREARERSLELVGYYHSHPGGRAVPSPRDRAHAWPEASYLILAPDGAGKLEARSWRLAGDAFAEEPVRWIYGPSR